MSHVLDIAMLAACSYALLAGDCTRVGASLLPQKCRFELYHSCIDKQQGGVMTGQERGTGDDCVLPRPEIFEKCRPDLRTFHWCLLLPVSPGIAHYCVSFLSIPNHRTESRKMLVSLPATCQTGFDMSFWLTGYSDSCLTAAGMNYFSIYVRINDYPV